MSQQNFPPGVTLAERVRWAERDMEDAARNAIAYPSSRVFLAALKARIADLDAMRYTLAKHSRANSHHEFQREQSSRDHRTTEHFVP